MSADSGRIVATPAVQVVRLPACTWRRVKALALGWSLVASGASGQSIRTILFGAETREPIAGAFVIVTDLAQREIARILTDETGRVSLDVPAGTWQLTVLRIGQTRWSGPLFTLASRDTLRTPIDVPEAPLVLSAIDVRIERRCRVRPKEGSAAATLWEEARKALEATEWTATHPVYRFQARRYTRTFDATGTRRLTEKRREISGLATLPFASSLPPEGFAARGYVQPDSRGVMT